MKWILIFTLIFSYTSFGQNQNLANVKSVNFIQEGEISKLIIDFDATVIAEKNHVKSDKQIILDLKNVTADKKFMRGIDTSEFSGSTVFVSPYRKPGSSTDLRFAIQLRDNVRSFVENKGTRLVLNIENRFGVFSRAKLKKAEQNEEFTKLKVSGEKVLVPKSNRLEDILENLTQSGVKRYVGKRISINVNDLPYPDVLKMIGDTSGFNIILSDDIKSRKPLTINLVNLPWDQVLDTIMDLGELTATKYGNILSIDTAENERERLKEQLNESEKNKELEPLVTKIFPLSYAEVETLEGILKDYLTPKRGSTSYDDRTQNLIVKDTVTSIEKIKKIIDILDTQTPQILIESKIVEATEKYEFKAGLANGINVGYNALSDINSVEPDNAQFDLSTATNPGTSLLAASINVARLTQLNFALELMESESKGKVITSPRIITENNKLAKITNSNERFFSTTTTNDQGNTVADVTKISADISLEVTPKVTNEGSILMKVSLSKSGFGTPEITGELPPTTARRIDTNVLVENGSTIVIGGLYQTEDSTLEQGIPFLKDLPLIGWLFRNAYNPVKERNELIVFLTPRIINQEEAGLVNRELGDDLGI